MIPPVNARTAAKAAFLLMQIPETERAEAFAIVIKAVLDYGRREGWSMDATAEFAGCFGDQVVARLHELVESRRMH
jgi:hypothetical protein